MTMLKNLLCKNIIVAKAKSLKTGCKLAESYKESYGSKKGCFAIDDGDDDNDANQSIFRNAVLSS
jgi:hypothetical protein